MPNKQDVLSEVPNNTTPIKLQERKIPAAPKKQRNRMLRGLKPIPFNLHCDE